MHKHTQLVTSAPHKKIFEINLLLHTTTATTTLLQLQNTRMLSSHFLYAVKKKKTMNHWNVWLNIFN